MWRYSRGYQHHYSNGFTINKMMKLGFSILVFFSIPIFAVLDPASLTSKVYAMYVSKSPYCTSPKLVFSKDNSTFYDVFGFPTLSVTDNKDHSYDGTYQCLIFKMSERFQFVPNVIGASTCSSLSVYTQDFCKNGDQTVGVDGTSISCSNQGDETVYLYLSTASSTNNPDQTLTPFSPPQVSDPSKGIKLDAPFTINGLSSGRLVVNGNSRIIASGGSCLLGLPKFSFVNE